MLNDRGMPDSGSELCPSTLSASVFALTSLLLNRVVTDKIHPERDYTLQSLGGAYLLGLLRAIQTNSFGATRQARLGKKPDRQPCNKNFENDFKIVKSVIHPFVRIYRSTESAE